MARPRDTLPPEALPEIEEIKKLNQQIEKLTNQRDLVLVRVASQFGPSPTARELGVPEVRLHKQVSRLKARGVTPDLKQVA